MASSQIGFPSVSGLFLQREFDGEHYLVDLTSDGERTRSLVEEREYDLAIVDWNVPYPSGLEVWQQRRARNRQLPIPVLKERNKVEDRVQVLRSTLTGRTEHRNPAKILSESRGAACLRLRREFVVRVYCFEACA